jgi:hypothetical protein
MEVQEQTSEADLIVTDAGDIETLYLVYFGRRTVLPAADAAIEVDELQRQFADLLTDIKAAGGRTYLLQGERLLLLRP